MSPEEIIEMAEPEAIVWDGFNDAIVGTDTNGKLVYDIGKMTEILMTRDGMEYEEAIEFLDFNVLCAYVGELTPVHINLYK